jgi:glycosyltransferase involved in cell wall biosynthesis
MGHASRLRTIDLPRAGLAPSPQLLLLSGLRVALFSGNYNYVMDGPVRALNKLVGHLEKRGAKALVFAPTTKTPAFQHEGELVSVPSIALPGSRSEYRLALGLDGRARQRLDAFRPTIVHVAAPDWLGLAALTYARTKGIPAVASFHTRFDAYPRYYGMAWAEQYVTAYLRYFYGRCDRVYAPSQSMLDELKADGIGRDLRLWTRGVDKKLFNPSRRDLAWRRALGLADDAIVVAFVGRLVREKGLHIFAEAFRLAQAVNPQLRALIVGEGPAGPEFSALLPTEVFVGHQEGDALARAYASADIFLNPSVTETFGNVTLEAMASGVPAICASASGSRSLVDHGVTGLLVDHAEGARGYADALVALSADKQGRTRFGAASLAKSCAFEWDAILDGLLRDYVDAMSLRRL